MSGNNFEGPKARLRQVASEEEYHQFLIEELSKEGWEVLHEVSPDDSSYRVDLLIRHADFGDEWIGIEAKYINTTSSGGIIAEAHQQITNQYWNQEYFGKRVWLWAISPYFRSAHYDIEIRGNREMKLRQFAGENFIREFICHYGIGYFSSSGAYAAIDFSHSNPTHKIPAFPIARDLPERYYENLDVVAIKESIKKKRNLR